MQPSRLALALVAALAALVLAGQASNGSLGAQSADPAGVRADSVSFRIIVTGTREEADRLLERLQRGDSFEALAKAESVDPSAGQGGMVGTVARSALRPEVQAALRGVAAGQWTGIVQIPTGFAILQVIAPPAAPSLVPVPPALAASGAVKYVLDVGGLPEAEAVLRDFSKPAGWNQDPRAICRARQDSLQTAREIFEQFFSQEMEPVRQTRPAVDLLQAHLGLAQLLAYQGDMARAMPHYEEAYRLAQASVPAAMLQAEETLGATYLHKAELDNGVYRSPGDLCLIPLRPGRAFSRTQDLEKAIAHFSSYLKRKPDELEVRWLLNLALMSLGTYPAGVPQADVIPPSAFASAEDIGRFTDVAPRAGLDVVSTAGGVIVDDLAGNGRFDVMTSNFDSCGPLHYLANDGDGMFTDRSAAAGLANQMGGLNLLQTDYDNDGCRDVLVLRGGWEAPQRNSLLHNNCDGTFTDVTVESGLADATSTQTAAWADINNDGLLDLFVGNEDTASQLFLNRGRGHFEDISHAAGVDRLAYTKGVNAGDYDNDGFADIYVSNFDGSNFLYHNNHDNTFTDVARAAGVPGSGRGFATWFFDFDNDGWLDLFATSYFLSVDETARTYLALPHNAPTLALYRNLGNGRFRDVTAQEGLDKVFMPMGANFGDVDNDGFLDVYLGMGTPSYASMAPHVLLRNREGHSFVDITASSGTGELHKGHGIAFADLDNDGDEDIVAEIGGATPGDAHPMRLFENPGQGNHWIAVKLVGVKSNRAAVGARIEVTVRRQDGSTRSIHRSVGSGGSFGASPFEQHIGLGSAVRSVDLEVWWPASNTRQHFSRVQPDQVVEISELASTYKPVPRPRVRLGGGGSRP